MAKNKPEVVYGGPYAEESAAIIAEGRKEKPDYDKLTADWKTISNGALTFIEKQKEGFDKPVGEFVSNVIIEHPEEPEVPEVHLYASNKEVSKEDAAKLGEEESKKSDEEKKNSESSDLEKELGL